MTFSINFLTEGESKVSNRSTQNIFRCRRSILRGNRCAFMKYERDKISGELTETGCSICQHDNYRIYPEHSSDGSYVHNRTNWTDPFPYGIDVIWENLSPHDTGLTYNYERQSIRTEDYNCHPLYTIKDINEPLVTGTVGDEHAAYAFGKNEPALSTAGWKIQDIKGLQRMEACSIGVYAQFSEKENLVFPKCLKDYSSDVADWVNYTTLDTSNPAFPRKKFFICHESNASIMKYCIGWFGNTRVAEAIYSILLAMKEGEFVNLKTALYANGVHRETSKKFRMEVSTMSKQTLYSGNMNIGNIYLYYHALGNMAIPEIKLRAYRANIINFLLNYYGTAELDPDCCKDVVRITTEGRLVYPTNRRYWYTCMILINETKRANRQSGIKGKMHKPLINYAKIPKWLMKQIKSMTEPETIEYADEDLKNPAVISIRKVLELKRNKGNDRKLRVFSRLLKAGRRWNQTEVRLIWFHFSRAYDSKKPEKFWQIVQNIRISGPGEVNNYLKQLSLKTGYDGELSERREFAMHLLEEMIDEETFAVKKAPLCDRWQRIHSKPGRSSLGPDDEVKQDRSMIFWNELRKVHARAGKYYSQISSDILFSSSKNDYEQFMEELEESVIMGTALDKEDTGRETDIRIIDIDGNEDTYGEGDTWQDTE